MKKMIAILMAVLMLAAMPVAASAATTTLTTTVPEATYTMNIPADMEIPFGAESTDIGTVTITDSQGFATGKNVYVKVEYTGLFEADGIKSTIPYTINKYGEIEAYGKESAVSSGSYLLFLGQDDGTTQTYFHVEDKFDLRFNQELRVAISSVDWGKALAGEYSTTITFTAQVANEEPTA